MNDDFRKEFNDVIKFFPKLMINRRETLGISKKQAADDLSVSMSVLDNWESGRYVPNPESILDICDYYCISLDMLFRLGDFEGGSLEDLLWKFDAEEAQQVA